MRNATLSSLAGSLAVLCAGCDLGGGADPRAAGAVSAVSATANLRGIWENMSSNATNAARSLGGFADVFGFLRMLAPSTTTGGSSVNTGARYVSFPDCVTVTVSPRGGSAVFSSCTAGGVTLSGTVTKDGDRYTTSDLRLEFMGGSGSASVSGSVGYRCDLTVSAAALRGTANLEASVTYGAQTSAVNISAAFNDITLCFDGTLPSGGSLAVTGSGTVAGVNVSANVAVTFGPTCGAARL